MFSLSMVGDICLSVFAEGSMSFISASAWFLRRQDLQPCRRPIRAIKMAMLPVMVLAISPLSSTALPL